MLDEIRCPCGWRGLSLPMLSLRGAGQVQAKPQTETRGPCLLRVLPWPATPAESRDLLNLEHRAVLRQGQGVQV